MPAAALQHRCHLQCQSCGALWLSQLLPALLLPTGRLLALSCVKRPTWCVGNIQTLQSDPRMRQICDYRCCEAARYWTQAKRLALIEIDDLICILQVITPCLAPKMTHNVTHC